MELHEIIILSGIFVFLLSIILFAIIYVRNSNKAVKDSQSFVTDKELLEFINSQPDKIVNAKVLMEEFGLSKFEARGRLQHLMTYGLLQVLRTKNAMQSYYTLLRPIEKAYDLDLTDDPFMTIEDLMLIFRHYDYQITLQEICLCTGLPIKVIIEEMKYFEKEKVIKCLLLSNAIGFYQQRVYTLCEPYRSSPESYIELNNANFELKEIYEKVRNI